MNTHLNAAHALMSPDSPLSTLGSVRRDRAVRRQVAAMEREAGQQHGRHRRRSLPPPL